MMTQLVFLISVFLIVTVPAGAGAHGTDYRLIPGEPVVTAEFFYSDRTPMQYAEVLIFSPDNRAVEYQNGRTDQRGRFAFCPDTPGEWQITVNDGMGHAVTATITVSPETAAGQDPTDTGQKGGAFLAETAVWVRVLLGVSVLLNIFWGVQIWKGRSR